jgi:ABC-2 type transport system ATP-binding protein
MEQGRLEAANITKSYRRDKILKGVSFVAPAGKSSCIVGQNGSGKSTLMQILAGVKAPDLGEVTLSGIPIRNREAARAIGFVSQSDCLFEHLSVKDNIKFWASAAGVSLKSPAAEYFMRLLGISSFWKQKVCTLSGGQRRRVAICAALAHDPACILLDEPFTGLDLVAKDDLFKTLDALCASGKTIIYTTHNIDEIRIHGKLILLRDGVTVDVNTDHNIGDFKQFMLGLIRGDFQREE